MLKTAHIAYTTTVEMSSSDDVDESYCFNLCSCIRSSNLSEYKEPITGDMQHAGVTDTGPYNKRLESIYAVESAVFSTLIYLHRYKGHIISV
jgi:hypothetical protein